jgi:predicted DNA-binding transcriptional regulator YafY
LLIRNGSTAHATWEVDPRQFTQQLSPIHLDYAQGAALYAATRLLSQQYDEHNEAVRTAILEIIGVFPAALQPHLEAIARHLNDRATGRDNLSEIFSTLSQGWLGQRQVQLTYEPLHGNAPYTCTFSPYLLEPSGVGKTLYFIGYSDPPGKLRTYKLERVRHAALTDATFAIPADFDGPGLLQRAWGIMYGEDEPIALKLRFSHHVSRRVRETRWHMSERLTDTKEGLIWEAEIGDLTGSDCEVLEPAVLRDDMVADVRRSMRHYGITATPAADDDDPDPTLLDDLFS